MKKNLLLIAIVSIISLSVNAQNAKSKDRFANVELGAQQKASIDSVRKIFDAKRSELKKDTSLTKEAMTEKRKALQKEQISVVNTFLTPEQKKQVKKKNKKPKKQD